MGILDNQDVLNWAYQAIARRARQAEKQHIEDITHDAIVAALKHINRYDPAKGSIYTFLHLYLRGALHHFRTTQAGHPGRSFKSMELGDKQKRPLTGQLHNDLRIDKPSPLSILIELEEAEWLQQQIKLLPPRQNAILTLYLQGLTYKQIGSQMGLASGTIKYHMLKFRHSDSKLNSHRNMH